MRNRTKHIARAALVAGGIAVLGGLGSTAMAQPAPPGATNPANALGDFANLGDLTNLFGGLTPQAGPLNQPPTEASLNNDSGSGTPTSRVPGDPRPSPQLVEGALSQALINELFEEVSQFNGTQNQQQAQNAQAPAEEGQQSTQNNQQSTQNNQQSTQNNQQPAAQNEQPAAQQPAQNQQPAGQQQPGRQEPAPQAGQQGLGSMLGDNLLGAVPQGMNLGENTALPLP